MDGSIDDKGYRPNVAMVILNQDNLVFWAKRCSMNAWQFPQGGIMESETPVQAMLRELREETGLAPQQVKVIAETRGWIRYEIPPPLRRTGKFVGQRQKWFLLRLCGPDSLIQLDGGGEEPEFDDWRWEDPAITLEQVVDFKRKAYEQAMAEFTKIINAGR